MVLPPSLFAVMDHAASTHKKNMQSHFRICTTFCSDLWSFSSCFAFLCRHCYPLHNRPTSTRSRFSCQKLNPAIRSAIFSSDGQFFSLLRVVEAIYVQFLPHPHPQARPKSSTLALLTLEIERQYARENVNTIQ